ncbi:CRISPR-associated helicase Cas3' [Candidatus Enterococcus willemsii]|uniref:CRISPR-associated helicase Cas3 n=1 Tax=Candidatus Enterococcus willemsii TaxID=1857215 RepID=A0ABQ6YVH4_9ENTE|nr:CRISPR-associated helicase Cas3' [Enterococcus sp. CU12B]KAF1301088.1 hypothetical protein BAU17_09710 [Enterococcus sp. CU12B]
MYAHYNQDTKQSQLLLVHLFNVADKSSEAGKEINQGYILFLIGLYHDLGKSDRLFQRKILKDPSLKVNHTSAGAIYLYLKIAHLLKNRIKGANRKYCNSFCEIIAYVISAHHGVYDIPIIRQTDDEEYVPKNFGYNKLCERLFYNEDKKYNYEEDVLPFAQQLEKELYEKYHLSFEQLVLKAFNEYVGLWEKLDSKDDSEDAYYRTLIVRLYLSLLKNADILDTVNAYEIIVNPMLTARYEELAESYKASIEEVYKNFQNPTKPINVVRTKIADFVKTRGMNDSNGIYRLDLPTGAGKTNLSMRYGFHQMVHQKKKRFIYITAYLSVLEQNAHEIKATVGNQSEAEGVLEHHSNVVESEEDLKNENDIGDEKKEAMKEYLVDSWDSPIVLSTMVQMFQTFFKTKASNIRRFSNLINSTIILDEVQSLPIDVMTLFNLTLNFLNKVMKVNVVLCTATQPVYNSDNIPHKIQYGGINGEETDIVQLTAEERQIFKRTTVYKFDEDNSIISLEEIAQEVTNYSEESILIILNTKSAVKNLYKLLKEKDQRLCYHLSTNMCAQHRLDIIKTIKEKLADEPVICISTQLIEAGVDLDFNRVIRSYAGIDSIVQANGRCNREGNLESGTVQLVNVHPEQENLTRLKSIRKKKKITEQIIKKLDSPIDIMTLNNEFFERYYTNSKPAEFNYPKQADEPTVYELLSLNKDAPVDQRFCLRQSFKSAGTLMNLIQSDTNSVIVYYSENKGKVEELIEVVSRFEKSYQIKDLNTIQKLSKELQPYTINMQKNDSLDKSIDKRLDGRIQILQETLYTEDMGAHESIEGFIY